MQIQRLYELARIQGGVFARWQARDLGFSHEAVARRLATKEWIAVGGGVLASANSALEPGSMEWAAYLACRPNAVLSGPSALRRHGLDLDVHSDATRWITIPPERHVRVPSVRTIRESLERRDILTVDGMSVTSVTRSIVDTLRVVPEYAGQPVLDRALLRGWLSVEELEARTIALAGRRGVGRLRSHLSRVRDGARSEAERRLHVIIADVPGWIGNFGVRDRSGTLIAVIDAAFPAKRVGVEIDGLAFHTDPERFQTDRTRQNRLIGLSWRILRYTWDDLTSRPDQVKSDILRELARQDPTLRSESRQTPGI